MSETGDVIAELSDTIPVCAIGASAGGVDALRRFFEAIDDDLGISYVVIVHLAPDHPSAFAQILRSSTTMPVLEVDDAPPLRENCVYVIPPDRALVIEGDTVTARPFSEPRGQRAPIDTFFRSVAAVRGDGLGVVLTGGGSDGAAGVKAIKEAGGVIFVQEPTDAAYPMMPRSAIATGVADFIAPIERMAERIHEVVQAKRAVRNLSVDRSEEDLKRIVGFLKKQTGHDFSSYKVATVMRRVTRRMQVTRRESLADYATYVRDTPEEAQELFSDLLISVTRFFRDGEAFEQLEKKAIRPLFDQLADDGEIRAWVVGCATGEEAYGLAILLIEEAERRRISVPIQIFATDLDEGAVATAREGRYPSGIEADVSPERLTRFFTPEGKHYRVKQEVRDVVLFALHSALKDPPFLRLDIISCRNLLIYLERDLQHHLAAMFRYGLKDSGFLFLGSAETVDEPSMFTVVDREARLYAARDGPQQVPFLFPRALGDLHAPRPQPRRLTNRVDEAAATRLHVEALERSAPPSILVDRGYQIVHLSPTAGRFLLLSGGAPSQDLTTLARPELRLDLTLALAFVFDKGMPTVRPPVPVELEGAWHRIITHVVPQKSERGDWLKAVVFFLDCGVIPSTEGVGRDDADGQGGRSAEMARLRGELRTANDGLSASRSQREVALQELHAANEELQSINEEYRSASEELETSKEELQSMNEELRTVNSELKMKLESISSAHSDLKNLVDSTEIGTLFLDNELRIRMFTPQVRDFINITDADAGRIITNFTNRLLDDGLAQEARQVLDTLSPAEREVKTLDGHWLMMRMRPYRTIDDRIAGVVVTFVDVTQLRTTAERLRQSEEKYRSLFEAMTEGFIFAEPLFDEAGEACDIVYHEANPAAHKFLHDGFVGRRLSEATPGLEPAWWQIPARVFRSGVPERCELYAAPLRMWFELSIWKSARNPKWVEIALRDITERRRAERTVRDIEARQRALIEGVPQLVWRTDSNGNWTWSSLQWTRYTGQSETQSLHWGWLDALHPDDRTLAQAVWSDAPVGQTLTFEARILHDEEGRYRWFRSRATPVLGESGELIEWLGTSTDIDDLRTLQEQQQVMVAELQHRTRNLLGVVRSVGSQTLAASSGLDDFATRFNDRLDALSRVQGLLSRTARDDITLADLVRMELDALGGVDVAGRTRIEGPAIRLRQSSIQTLALALHELATNARKYGALASDAGQLWVTWRVEGYGGNARLVLTWLEKGIKVSADTLQMVDGYGRSLITKALPYALGAATSHELETDQLRCTIDLPLSRIDHVEES